MADDDGQESDGDSVLIPLSLIHALTFGMLHALDEWHEARGIEEPDMDRCFVAMIASVEAAMERLGQDVPHPTIQ